MSSADATVDDTVVTRAGGRTDDATLAATVLVPIAVAQLVWVAALVYFVIRLLT